MWSNVVRAFFWVRAARDAITAFKKRQKASTPGQIGQNLVQSSHETKLSQKNPKLKAGQTGQNVWSKRAVSMRGHNADRTCSLARVARDTTMDWQ